MKEEKPEKNYKNDRGKKQGIFGEWRKIKDNEMVPSLQKVSEKNLR